jgi:hypothetical protein
LPDARLARASDVRQPFPQGRLRDADNMNTIEAVTGRVHRANPNRPRGLLRRVAFLAGCYGIYLVLLGPFYACVGDGPLSSMPRSASELIFLPAMPVYSVPLVRSLYDDYLEWWYVDPNAADRPTGWF